jgi:hypothetical protein
MVLRVAGSQLILVPDQVVTGVVRPRRVSERENRGHLEG